MRKHDLRTLAIVAGSLAVLFGLIRTQPMLGGPSRESLEGRAVLSATTTRYDLGQTAAAKRWRVVFPVRNLGTRRLVLNELNPGCDCGDRSLSSIVVPSGGSVELAVVLDTRLAAGPVENARMFTTNDPRCPRLELKVSATIAASPTGALAALDDGDTVD